MIIIIMIIHDRAQVVFEAELCTQVMWDSACIVTEAYFVKADKLTPSKFNNITIETFEFVGWFDAIRKKRLQGQKVKV